MAEGENGEGGGMQQRFTPAEVIPLEMSDVTLTLWAINGLRDIDHQLVVTEGQLRGALLPRDLLALILLDNLRLRSSRWRCPMLP